jgi:sporulation protein YlmC with PRC-barrel domain
MAAGAVRQIKTTNQEGLIIDMKNTFRTTVCCIACTLLAASAWAQREPGSSSSQQSPSSSSSSQGGLGSQSSQRSSSYSSSHGQQSFRVSQQIINAQVKTQDGQQLGQIEDLIANPQTGKIEFAVVSKGEKLYPIPMQLLQCQPGSSSQGSSSTSTSGTTSGTSSTSSDPSSSTSSSTSPTLGRSSSSSASQQKVTFVAQVDQQKLQQAPSFSRTQWPEMSQSWSQQIYSHFGVSPEAAGGTGSSGSTYQGKSSSGSTGSGSSSTSGSSSSDKSKSSDPQKKSEN